MPFWRPLAILVMLLSITPLGAQAPHELSRQDKIERYLQYLGRVVQLDLDIFSALLLEFELARSMNDIGSPHPEPLIGDFIHRSNKKLHPRYARAVELYEKGELDAARKLFEELAQEKELYVAAGAEMYLVELDHAAKSHAACLRRASDFAERRRNYLLADYRACELIALGFRALGKPLLEYLQYHILLIDYREVPPEVEERAKARLAELQAEAGQPISLVGGWMGEVTRWINEYETGSDPTQDKQKKIRAGLEKLIELQVAKERNTCQNCGKGG